ncbi:MAG TPA: hypothetical protein VNI84_11695 [Pyrinomonadaceae bacterium]|nr:hypothetical protein [Pyrinomonadaceae bacterium]
MLEAMNEPDEVWARKLDEALRKAKAAERGDVAEYLLLRTANDAIRRASVDWLLDSATVIAAESDRQNARITIEKENPHSFTAGHANLVGSRLTFRQGVRCLTIEAGWTRAPQDGFMRGGALARARLSHFGMSRNDEELLLVRDGDVTNWFAVDKENKRELFDSRNLQRHFAIFSGELSS